MRRKTLLVSSIALALGGVPSVQAALVTNVYGPFDWSTDSANFTMLTPAGYTMGLDGGDNNVNMVWDGNAYNANSDYTGPGSVANMTMSSSDTFFGYTLVAHDIQVFVPGSYSFDAGDNTPGPGTGGSGGTNAEAAGTILNATVPAGMIGIHMLFDWNANLNIDVFVVFAPDSVFGAGIGRSTTGTTSGGNNCDNNGTAGIKNCLFDGKPLGPDGKPLGNKVWMLASVDGNGDGIMGIPMATGGPWQGFNLNFNAMLSPLDVLVPVPATVWLFGSGLLGLIGVAHRRKKTA